VHSTKQKPNRYARIRINYECMVNEGDDSILVKVNGGISLIIPRSLMESGCDIYSLKCTVPYWFAYKHDLV